MHETEHERPGLGGGLLGPTGDLAPARDEELLELIEGNADGMLVVDAGGQVRLANRMAEQLLRRTRGDLLGRPFGAPVIDGDAAELDLPRGRGEHAIAEMRVVRIRWAGTHAHLVALRDVTAKKWAELHLRTVYEISSVLSRARTLSDGLEHFLAIVCQSIGRKSAELWLAGPDGLTRTLARGSAGMGTGSREMPRLVQLVWQRLQARWVTDVRQEDVHLRFGWPPGRETSAVAFLVGDRARPLGVTVLYGATRMAEIPELLGTLEVVGSHVGLFVERMRAEGARRDSFELLRAILDDTPGAVTVKDADGRYQVVNAAAAEQLGCRRDVLLGSTDSVLAREVAAVIEANDRAFLEGGPAAVVESFEVAGVPRTVRATRKRHTSHEGATPALIRTAHALTEP